MMLRANHYTSSSSPTSRIQSRRLDIDATPTTSSNLIGENGENNTTTTTTTANSWEQGRQQQEEELATVGSSTMGASGNDDGRQHPPLDMVVLNEIFFCAVLGLLFCLCHTIRRCCCRNRANQHNELHTQVAHDQPPAHPNGMMMTEEKVARKAFVEENLPAKEWCGVVPSNDHSESLEAGLDINITTANGKDHTISPPEHSIGTREGDDDPSTISDSAGGFVDECPICLNTFKKGDLVSCSTNPFRCQHIFHRKCVYIWLLKHRECPMCRHPFLVVSRGGEDEGKNKTKTTVSSILSHGSVDNDDEGEGSDVVRGQEAAQ